MTTEALKYIFDFEIKALDYLYTDGHAILTTTLEFEGIISNVIRAEKITHRHNARNEKKLKVLIFAKT